MPILVPGQIFGPYRLVAPLSRGGMGEVWRALRTGSGTADWSRQVALKVILPGYADSEQFADLFAGEARIAASLSHANIVGVSNYGMEAGILFLEQELVDGADLARLLEQAGGFPPAIAIFVIIEALKGLAYAHDHRLPDGRPRTVIHRDIKPANILVAREGHVKLADFGVAKVASQSSQSMTQLRGTIGYIAPEMIEGRPPTPRSDLFAMGLIFWELLTGRRLFAGENEAVKLLKTYECLVPPLASYGVQVAPEIEAVLRGLLARDPEARFASAADAIRGLLASPEGRAATSLDLKAFIATLGMPELPVIDLSPPTTLTAVGEVGGRREGGGRRLTLVAIGLLAAAAIGAVAAILPRVTASKPPLAATPPPPAPRAPPAPAPVAAPPDAGPRLAHVTFRLTPADAQLSVNGAPVKGPPFVVDVAPGSALALRVERPGYVTLDDRLTVDADAMTVPIALVAAPAEAAPAPAPPPSKRSRPSSARRKDGMFLPED